MQNVFDTYRQDHYNNFLQNLKDRQKRRLDQLVSDGKITSGQEQSILDEYQHLQSEYPLSSIQGLTQEQRKQKMSDIQNEINSWAQSQNIDPKYVLPFGPGKAFFHMPKGHKK